ncbi:chromate efflux transporter [Rhizobium sp.]|uniref:chromate efflux transporter n=1 Tax=Rhizobium sp. TaxID=391 RepID=UPI000E914D09|nr:chromate transporter [Rhizobium sp.]
MRQNDAKTVAFTEICKVFAPIGFMSFGGPAAQIGLMHKMVVDERRWLDEAHFLHALNYCMLLPGPEAQQLATYIGWLTGGVRGGIVAGLLFVLPGLMVMLGLSTAYAVYHDIGWVAGLFFGLKAAVLAIVLQALMRIGKRALKSDFHRVVAGLAFLALFCLSLPFPLVIVLAAIAGLIRVKFGRVPPPVSKTNAPTGPISVQRSVISCAIWLGLWLAPLLILSMIAGQGRLLEVFSFFARMALVTFGGAYAVLAYVAQVAVEHYHWLKPGEMLDGLALAETTPGPLVLVLSFVGFLAAFRESGALAPVVAGLLGGVLTAWATFMPSFLFIFAGAPIIERLRGHAALDAALSSITAAVVGVILNLSVWFGLHVLFADVARTDVIPALGVSLPIPAWASLDVFALAITLVAAVLLFQFQRGIATVLGVAAVMGVVIRLAH